MKAMMLTGIRTMEAMDVPDPKLSQDTDVLIKMGAVGVCGSDIHYYVDGKIGKQVVEYPYAVGHEGAGTIEAVGAAVTMVQPGDRIAIEPAMPCHACDQCKAGRHHTCRSLRFLGCPNQADGLLCEYLVMPQECCFKIPDTMSLEQAAASEPLAIGVYAVKESRPMNGMRIGILGAGPIGMSVQLPALAQGVEKVYVTDKIDSRCERAREAGATWAGNPDREDVVAAIADREPLLLDVVFECCGDQEALDQAIQLLKPGGKLMIVGIPATLDRVSFRIDDMRHKEICIQNVRRQCDCVQAALDMITHGEIDIDSMITHRFTFDQTRAAFELVADYRDGVVKAMINYE